MRAVLDCVTLEALFQDAEQAQDGLGVLNAPIVNHPEGFRVPDDLDLDDFVLVGMRLSLGERVRFVEVHEFRCKTGRRPESR